MNDLLTNLEKSDTDELAYADDLAMIIAGQTKAEVKHRVEQAIDVVENWCQSAKLKISTEKSQLLNVGRLDFDLEILIDKVEVERVASLKYLGVMIDKSMKWMDHLNMVSKKVDKCIKTFNFMKFMNPLMSIDSLRVLYNQLMVPIVSYGSKVWYEDIKFKYQRKLIEGFQRKTLLSLSKAYRTTSTVKLKSLFRVIDLNKQIEFLEYDSGTRESKIKEELVACDLNVNYGQVRCKELIWFIVDHGPFRSYLFRFNLADDDTCRFCLEDVESPSHLLFSCCKFDRFPSNNVEELEMKSKYITIEIFKLNKL